MSYLFLLDPNAKDFRLTTILRFLQLYKEIINILIVVLVKLPFINIERLFHLLRSELFADLRMQSKKETIYDA